ncbi:MAG: hypothetical protein ACXU9K_08945 [Thermodesulfobacteriota bacterium]
MKTGVICVIVLFIVMFASFAHALEAFELYDGFSSKIIDETKWYGSQTLATGVNIVDQVLQISSGKLHMLGRFYGNMSSDTGASRGFYKLQFANPATITAMEATVQVKQIEADACPNNTTPTTASASLQGSFFNAGTPTPGSEVDDVLALIFIERTSDSTDQAGILQVVGAVSQCTDSTCATFTVLSSQTLGTIKVGKKTTLSIQWDQPNHQFIFQFGKLAPVLLTYGVSDTSPPGVNFKDLRLRNYIANCTTGTRLVSFVEAYFDNVFVNQSAVPAP